MQAGIRFLHSVVSDIAGYEKPRIIYELYSVGADGGGDERSIQQD